MLQCDDVHKGDNCAGTVGASAACGPARAGEEVHLSFSTVTCCCLDNAKYFPLELRSHQCSRSYIFAVVHIFTLTPLA